MRNIHQMGWPIDEIYIPTPMPRTGRRPSSSPLLSEESVLDHEVGFLTSSNQSRHYQPSFERPPSLQAIASGAQHSESSAAYFRWPPLSRIHGTAEERSAYFSGLRKEMHSESDERAPAGPQACTLLDLMTIRAFHSKLLRQFSLGTAIGFRTTRGILTDIPAIIVFVAHKVHKEWLLGCQKLPPILEGPGGIWCDVDVVEFLYYGTPPVAIKEQVYTELVDGLRGNSPCIGPGSQVASQETYGTLGAIVQSKTGLHQVGFVTNRHVAVDLDYPNQKMFHPLPPNLGPGVYLGAVERATSFITDDLWYGIFASMNPETFVRADGAFIPFGDCFDLSKVTTAVKGVGDVGEVMNIDLQAPIGSIVGMQVVKVGRSSGLTRGSIMAYALEYNDEKGICFFTDFLIVGENNQPFDLEGDSGSLILTLENGEKPKPVGIIWGGMANRGRLKLRNGYRPESWTSGVDLGRLLDLLQLSLITTSAGLAAAAEEQSRLTAGVAMEPIVGETPGTLEQETVEAHTLEPEPGDGRVLAIREGAAKMMQGKAEDQCIRPSPPDPAKEAEGKGIMLETYIAKDHPGSSTKVLDLLDFGFAVKSAQAAPAPEHSDKAPLKDGDGGNGEEIVFGLNLFVDSRDPKRKKPSSPTDS